MVKVIDQVVTDDYAIYHGDCVELMKDIPDNSIHYSIYSPPFASLYVFSNSDRDMSNCGSHGEFYEHYKHLIREHYRTQMPGRLISVHCVNLPTTINREGYAGIRDFRGEIIRLFQECGFIYHSEVVIWKNPVVAMQRTKAQGLLHAQIKKDSSISRMGIPDYVVTFKKPGKNETPISGMFNVCDYAGEAKIPEVHSFYYNESGQRVTRSEKDRKEWESIEVWQRYASPVWMDIQQGDVLEYRKGRGDNDEKHITPLQLQVIDRCLQLWSLPGETVLSPFGGIGSEGYMAIKRKRKPVLFELKESYFNIQKQNMEKAVIERDTPDLFGDLDNE